MHDWCRKHVGAAGWQQHGYIDKRYRTTPGGPIDVTHWYFLDAANAEAFKQRWLAADAPKSIPQIRHNHLIGRVRKMRTELLAYFEEGRGALDPREAAQAAKLMEDPHDLLLKVARHPDWIDGLALEPPAAGSFNATK